MSSNLPSTELPGAIPTLNGRGFMLETLDEYAQEFVRAAAGCDSEVLDIGCAYGAAILASRVLLFLKGEDLRATPHAMHSWLRPGGSLFPVADTPYMPSWNDIVPQYERLEASGTPWPGFIPDFSIYTMRGLAIHEGPPYLNTLDADILVRECSAAGFDVGRHGYFAFSRIGAASIGRSRAGLKLCASTSARRRSRSARAAIGARSCRSGVAAYR